MHLLLVEDHDDTRVVLAKLLTHCGHDVAVASDARSALELLTHLQFDVLVSDLGLPDRDGLDLVSDAKKTQALKMTIALTARTSGDDRERALKAGFDHYLTKPFDFHRLRTLLA